MFNKYNLAQPPDQPMCVPTIDEEDSDRVVAEFVKTSPTRRGRSARPTIPTSATTFSVSAPPRRGLRPCTNNTKFERLRRLNMLVGEEETEDTAAEATDTVGTSSRGGISTKGGLLLNNAVVVAALDDAEQRRAVKESGDRAGGGDAAEAVQVHTCGGRRHKARRPLATLPPSERAHW
jgi:hypothetical protein